MNARATQQLLSKLSLAKIFGKIDIKALHESGKAHDLYTIGGTATGIKTGNSTYGEWTSFTGTFAAVRADTGEIYRAAQVFLPTIATDYILPAVESAAGDPIEFAMIIGVKPMNKPDGSPSYEYTVKPVIDMAVVDPLDAMLTKLQALAPRQLAAPEVAPEEVSPEVEPEVVPETPAEPVQEHHEGKGKRNK